MKLTIALIAAGVAAFVAGGCSSPATNLELPNPQSKEFAVSPPPLSPLPDAYHAPDANWSPKMQSTIRENTRGWLEPEYLGDIASGIRPVKNDDFSASQHVLKVSTFAAFYSQVIYVLADDLVVVEVYKPENYGYGRYRYELVEQRWKKLDERTASLAWKRIEELKISDWKKRYSPSDLGMNIADGLSWWVSLRAERAKKESEGFNVYPALSPLGAPTRDVEPLGKSIPTAFRSLLDLFDEFTGKI